LRDFIDENIPSIYIERITVRKKIKIKQKKKLMTCYFSLFDPKVTMEIFSLFF
jgi:hypothetical protein